MSAIETALRHNDAYATRFEGGGLPARPARRLAVVTCMDARLIPSDFLGLESGDAHVIRNAGGVVTDDVIRSLAISQAALGTRDIMVVQHTACGMLAPGDDDLADTIEGAAGHRPEMPLGTFPALNASVQRSLRRLRASSLLAHRDRVRGFVYDVETGRLREVT